MPRANTFRFVEKQKRPQPIGYSHWVDLSVRDHPLAFGVPIGLWGDLPAKIAQ
jgi:hypothetical protein